MSHSTHPRQSSRAAAFLLIIPGSAAIGFGIGLALANPAPGLIIGIGAGAFMGSHRRVAGLTSSIGVPGIRIGIDRH